MRELPILQALVPSYANASRWLPLDPLAFCIIHTECKLVILDAERAEKLQPIVDKLYAEHNVTGILVFNSLDRQGGKAQWRRMKGFEEALQNHSVVPLQENVLEPEDEALIMFTSGILGLFPPSLQLTGYRYDGPAKGCIEYPTSILDKFTQRMVSN